MRKDFSRRELLGGALTSGVVAATGMEVGEWFGAEWKPEPLKVPQALPTKLANTTAHGIRPATHEAHLKLWQGYANKTNEIQGLLKNIESTTKAPNQIYSEMRALKANYAFAYGGYINHEIYFDGMGGNGANVPSKVATLLRDSYGSVENWSKELKATGIAARGWVFVAVDHRTGQVMNLLGDSQDTFPMWHHTPILALDVYEHAYYLDFQTNRGAYIDAFLKCIDWAAVEKRLPKL